MRDWLTAFRPASFRGAAFHVETEGAGGGRRVAVSPIAYSDRYITEDMGGREQRFQLTAYVAGDASDRAARALVAALAAKGPATLVLPMIGPRLAHAPEWSLNRDKSRAGHVAFDISFVASGGASPLFAAVPGSVQIIGLMEQAAALFSGAVRHAMRAASPSLEVAVSGSVRTASAALAAIGSGSIADAGHRDHVSSLARQLDLMAGSAGIAENSASLICDAALVISVRGDATALSNSFAAAIPSGDDPAALTAAALFAAGHCQALCAVAHQSRQDARSARARIAPVMDDVTLRLGSAGFTDAALWLEGIAAIAADDLSATAANRAPLVRVETGQSLPATLIAHALYGDASRAGEIVRRNRAATPALMPVTLEALAN